MNLPATPSIGTDSTNFAAQNATDMRTALFARRHAEAGTVTPVSELPAADSQQASTSAESRLNALEGDGLNANADITDSNGADAVMQSLRASFLGQSNDALQTHAGLSPQSVLNLLE